MDQLTLRQPDDFHVHLRQGSECGNFARDALKAGFARVLVMPNTLPPIVDAPGLRNYQREIEAAAPGLRALMTFKIHPNLDRETLAALKEAGAVAGKLYPAGVTTNSDDGVANLKQAYPVFALMEELDLVLCVHGEDPDAFSLDREKIFLKGFKGLTAKFPKLRMVLEHISTAEGVRVVTDMGSQVAGTITIHHLLHTLDDVLGGKLNPHLFCKPLLKRPEDRTALVEAAFSGSKQFFFGSDSAPHVREDKESGLCSAGCYTMPVSLSLLADLFEKNGHLDLLENFVSTFGADFYRLPRNPGMIRLAKEPWRVSKLYHGVVPLYVGETMNWTVAVEKEKVDVYDPDNIFAKILRGEIPCHKVYEDDGFLAFLDIFPVNPGHFLVIPKKPFVLASELDHETAGRLFEIGVKLSRALRASTLRCEGVNFWISDGEAAGQEVPHVHLHVIPRFAGDGFGWKSGPNNRKALDHPVLAKLAEEVRSHLKSEA